MSATVREQSAWTVSPNRGAPLVGLLVVFAFGGLSLAAGGLFDNVALFLVFAYALAAGAWTRQLAQNRWPRTRVGIAPEACAIIGSLAVLLTGYLFYAQGDRVLPWITLALHLVITAVITPVTLRRYPGVR